jgi:hypothetical protein
MVSIHRRTRIYVDPDWTIDRLLLIHRRLLDQVRESSSSVQVEMEAVLQFYSLKYTAAFSITIAGISEDTLLEPAPKY